jgi:hypothetical protein
MVPRTARISLARCMRPRHRDGFCTATAYAGRARDLGSDGLAIVLRQRLPALIAANSVLAFATNRHTVAASSE